MNTQNARPAISADATLSIEWDNHRRAEWGAYIAACPKANIIQTDYYARTLRKARQQVTRFGLIRMDGVKSGIVQVQEIKLGPLHFVFLDHGPLWFEGVDEDLAADKFFEWFGNEYRKRFLRWRRILPSLKEGAGQREMLEKHGLRYVSPGYSSIVIDLRQQDDALVGAMSKGWRGALKSAVKSELKTSEEHGLEHLPFILKTYSAARASMGYAGLPPSMLAHLCGFAVQEDAQRLYLAHHGDEIVAWMLVFLHGHGATYQAGWTGRDGRALNAHNLLMWEAITRLREEGIERFDLGGINPETAGGVTRFKRGTGGSEFRLAGIYK